MNRGLSRTQYNQLATYVVTEDDLQNRLPTIVEQVNMLDGPIVAYDEARFGYGLAADKAYSKGDKVTTYGGIVIYDPKGYVHGDYVAALGKSGTIVDGRYGFQLREKGRWINEYDRYRTVVNVEITRLGVYALTDIEKGAWFFANYGGEYERNY